MGKMKIVCISDTHGLFPKNLPKGDILIHAGDWSATGSYRDTVEFLNRLEKISYKYKNIVVVPGNHEKWIEGNISLAKDEFKNKNISLLIDKSEVINGLIFYGTPWVPVYKNWSFMKEDADRKLYMDAIPEDTEVLITHAPPYGYLDVVDTGKEKINVGCKHLLEALNRCDVKLHVFGHVHESAGVKIKKRSLMVNASCLDKDYKLSNNYTVVYIK